MSDLEPIAIGLAVGIALGSLIVISHTLLAISQRLKRLGDLKAEELRILKGRVSSATRS